MTRTLFRWTLRLLLLAVMLATAAGGLAYYLAARSLPDYDATHRIAGAPGTVEIVRDRFAVPHITGDTDAAVLFGLGFAHAQDRLWQMTMARRVAQGRLAELFGPEQVSTDHLLRALDLYGAAAAAARVQRPEVIAELQAYADGVNAYVDLVREQALGRGAPEFFLFEPTIATWTPTDSIAVIKVMALQLTDQAQVEALRARLSLRLPPERLADILPEPPGAVIAPPDYAGTLGVPRWTSAALPPDGAVLPPRGRAGASNAFAAAADRAAAGAPLLATDPHLSLTAPGPFFLAQLDLETGPVIGATLPGVPGVLLGRNERFAWGLTSSYLDDQDIFIERLADDDPQAYLTPDGTALFETRDAVINVAGAPAETRQLRWSRHGPVIPPPHFGVDAITPQGHVAALAWTALDAQDRTIEGALALMRVQSLDDLAALRPLFHSPSFNLVAADAEGIAQYAIGAAPARQTTQAGQGRIPSAGWVAENDWQGYLDPLGNPGLANPGSGIVVNTNNRTTQADFPQHWTFDWGDSHRIARAQRLLNAREFHTLDSFIEVQLDIVSPVARAVLPLIAQELWYQDSASADTAAFRQRQQVLEALAVWSGEMDQHSFEPLVFSAWLRQLQRRLVLDELGPLTSAFATPDPLFLERVFRDVDGAAAWCDIAQSERVEPCQEIARQALDAALAELTETYGARVEAWRWGAAHVALHRHPVLGHQPALGWLTNIEQETPGGDTTLLRGQTAGGGDQPYRNIHASVFRAVIDFADPEASVYITSTGQSGHVLSRHYDDLSVLWRRGEYVSMSMDPAIARGAAVGITRIAP
ncbi:MAG: penicillin acylase family protein [Pseudomonadota bacterium]